MATHENIELSPTEWVRNQTAQILQNGTTEGVEVAGRPVVLLTMTGAKSGKTRAMPVMRVEHDGAYAIVASKGGSDTPPAWYLNLEAKPEVGVQVKGDRVTAKARVADSEERERLWPKMTATWPAYDDYQEQTEREIPIVVLERAA